MTAKTIPANTYETDFHDWAQQQAELLKARRWEDIDLENLIEEIEGLGASKRDALVSQIARLYLHLLKWHHQAHRRSRSWELSIKDARIEITDLLADNPSLRARLPELIAKGYSKARRQAEAQTGLAIDCFPLEPALGFEQAMVVDFMAQDGANG
ncbi:MAG: DUF29 domain-containing protein [Cyanobacteria bacterium]|nr:DUF29 domain-containing protein [Cyanobacteriota bacterium]